MTFLFFGHVATISYHSFLGSSSETPEVNVCGGWPAILKAPPNPYCSVMRVPSQFFDDQSQLKNSHVALGLCNTSRTFCPTFLNRIMDPWMHLVLHPGPQIDGKHRFLHLKTLHKDTRLFTLRQLQESTNSLGWAVCCFLSLSQPMGKQVQVAAMNYSMQKNRENSIQLREYTYSRPGSFEHLQEKPDRFGVERGYLR